MELMATLRQDHAHLRKKLTLLGSALQVAPEARLVLREMCFSLQRLLEAHMRREVYALQRYDQQVPAGRYLTGVGEHVAEHRLLRTVNELLINGMKASVPMVILRLSQAMEQLEAQMHEQERTVFASLDLAEASPASEATSAISRAMSVNEILQRFPQTERVFEQLHVNRLQEGYESVDEFAWRHGMDASQVIEQLRQVVAFPNY